MDWSGIDMPALERELTALRREFHQYPESGWTEFRTTARIIEELERLGLEVRYGQAIHVPEKRYGLPSPEKLEDRWQRAHGETNRHDLLKAMRGGYTGCLAAIEGAQPGPTVAIRVDIDCNEVEEARDAAHRPAAEGFRSEHAGCMHACGHDAHIAIGIGAAKLLCAQRHVLCGRVLLLFQPAEEGLRGAASFAAAGHFKECERLFGLHVGLMDTPVGTVAASCRGFLASSKFDVTFHGVAAHAGLAPEQGRNALAAAATATLQMLDIPARADGLCRVNVGTLHAGSGRNVIPAEAVMQVETRGATTEIDAFAKTEAKRICQAAAKQYGCTCETAFMGSAGTAVCDEPLVEQVLRILPDVEGVETVLPEVELAIGEDITTLMAAVQAHGGQATELVVGMPLPAPHHNGRFDIDERVLGIGARSLAALALQTH